MRFLLYDAVSGMEKGKSIVGHKTFSLSEEFLRAHFTKTALVPGVLMIEAMAQLLGWLVIYSHDFKLSAVMSLIEDVNVSSRLRPGFRAEIHAEIVSTSARDSLGTAKMFVDGRLIASIGRIIYVHTKKVDSGELMRLFGYYTGLRPAEMADF